MEDVDVVVRRSRADHQAIWSPYRLGVSPRTKASNVLFSTADQSRSRLSSATSSVHSPSSSMAPAAVRAIRSPLTNRGPRSGQCLFGSKGCHLKDRQPTGSEYEANGLPEVMEVVRERALEEAIESHSLWCRTVLGRSIEEVTEPESRAHKQMEGLCEKCRLTLGSTAGADDPSGKTRCSTKQRRRVHRAASTKALPGVRPWYTSTPSLDGNPIHSSEPS